MTNRKNPSVLAAMAGITDGNFASRCMVEGGAGLVTIGGYSIGKEMISASNQIMSRGRKEFLLIAGKEAEGLITEINKISSTNQIILNLRINNYEDIKGLVKNLNNQIGSEVIIEINAHCRQPEVIKYGGGEALLSRINTLKKIIDNIKGFNFRVSLKIRGNKVNPNLFIEEIKETGLDFLHIDSYRVGVTGTDLHLLNLFTKNLSIPIIGNNSIIDFKSAQSVLDTGAKYFSVARAAERNLQIFKEILKHL